MGVALQYHSYMTEGAAGSDGAARQHARLTTEHSYDSHYIYSSNPVISVVYMDSPTILVVRGYSNGGNHTAPRIGGEITATA